MEAGRLPAIGRPTAGQLAVRMETPATSHTTEYSRTIDAEWYNGGDDFECIEEEASEPIPVVHLSNEAQLTTWEDMRPYGTDVGSVRLEDAGEQSVFDSASVARPVRAGSVVSGAASSVEQYPWHLHDGVVVRGAPDETRPLELPRGSPQQRFVVVPSPHPTPWGVSPTHKSPWNDTPTSTASKRSVTYAVTQT